MEPGGRLPGLLQVGLAAGQQQAVELAGDAAAQAEEPLVVGLQQLAVDPGLEIEPFQEGLRGELHEVLEARAIGGQQREVEAGLLAAAGVFLGAAAGGDVGLQAEDRVDAQFLRLPVELHRPVQVAVVGQGQGVHLQGLGPVEQAADRARPVQEAVVAVTVQVGEGMAAHGTSYSSGSPTAPR